MKLVLLGPPGAGKGTQANLLKDSLNLIHISTGDILREEMKHGSPLGQEVKRYVDQGALVPDEIVTKIVENRLAQNAKKEQGYMLDGFPRTRNQAEDLDKILNKIKCPIDYAVYMEATLPIIIKRLTGRRVCKQCGALFHVINKPAKKDGICDVCGGSLYQRADDNEKTIKNRMEVYLSNTQPIIEHYENQKKLIKVDADLDAIIVKDQLMKIFDESGKLNKNKIS